MSLSVDINKQLRGFELSASFVAEGVHGLLGVSGAGKSVTLGAIAGINEKVTGKICLNQKPIFDSENKINLSPRMRKCALVSQSPSLFANMTASENIACVIKNKIMKKAACKELLQLFKVSEHANKYPRELSGGQAQRVAFARAIASEPDCLLLDEPFSALDSILKRELIQDLLPILQGMDIPILYVSHDVAELTVACKKISVIHEGAIIKTATAEQLSQDTSHEIIAKLFSWYA